MPLHLLCGSTLQWGAVRGVFCLSQLVADVSSVGRRRGVVPNLPVSV